MTEKRTTPTRAIRQKCLECAGDQQSEVRLCHMDDCPLWPFRMGKNPNASRPWLKGRVPACGKKTRPASDETAPESK